MELVEIRDHDGPNLFMLRPAIKLEVVVEPGERISDQRRQRAAGLTGEPLGPEPMAALGAAIAALHRRLGLPVPDIGHRALDQPNYQALFYPWEWRSTAIEIAKTAFDLLGSEATHPDPLQRLQTLLTFDREQNDRPEWIRDEERRIPAAGITGTNGKTTTTRLLAHIARQAGRRAGWCSSTGIYIDGEQVEAGDYSGFSGARTVLRDPRVEVAVLETARGGILLRGVGYQSNDVGVMLNISGDHLGLQGITRLETLAKVKSVVLQVTRPDGLVVLNADDSLVLAQRCRVRAEILLTSQQPDNPEVEAHCQAGGMALVRDGEWIVLRHGAQRQPVISLAGVPMTFGGAAPHMVENALAACGAALGLGFSLDQIVAGLGTFRSNTRSNAGRLNVFSVDGRIVVVDYAHNESGLTALLGFAQRLASPNGRLTAIIGTAGDRQDDDFRRLGRIAAERAERILLSDSRYYLRGRPPGQSVVLMREGVEAAGIPDREVDVAVGKHHALVAALDASQPGDVIAMMCQEDQDEVLDELRQRGAEELG